MTDIATATAADTTADTDAATTAAETDTSANADTAAATPTFEDLQAQLAAANADRDKWKSMSRKHEATAKATPASDTGRIAALEARTEAAERKALTTTIAATKGVPVEVLHGADEDELNASADRFLAAVTAAAAAKAPAPAPANDAAASGARGTAVGSSVKQLTRADLAGMKPAEIVAAKAAGQLNDVLGIR